MAEYNGEVTTDSDDKVALGAIKYDGNKSPLYQGAVAYFPRALRAVASVSAFGASKYSWGGWRGVSDAENRYTNSMLRHLTYIAEGESTDPDSGHPHSAHVAWNALALLELALQEEKPVE